jgi:hypothetical protein
MVRIGATPDAPLSRRLRNSAFSIWLQSRKRLRDQGGLGGILEAIAGEIVNFHCVPDERRSRIAELNHISDAPSPITGLQSLFTISNGDD